MASHFSGQIYAGGVPLPQVGGALAGRVLFVRSAGAPEDFPDAYRTMAGALSKARSGDTIVLLSDLREEVDGNDYPYLFDLTIVGNATRPRHDDKHNFPSTFQMGCASWRNSSGVTTVPLLKLYQQGWKVRDILFDAPTTAAAVELYRNASSGEDERDASHASFYGCRLAGGETGIEVIGTENVFNVGVYDCVFQDLTDGIKGLNAYRWEIHRNKFVSCTNCIDAPAVQSEILGNRIVKAPTKGFDLTGGSDNRVGGNYFAGDYNVINVAGTNDDWSGNYASETGGVTDAVPTGS